jgi:hypothetical protein
VNVVMNLRVPYRAGKFLTSWGHVSFSGKTLLHGVSDWVNELACFCLFVCQSVN